VELLVVDGSSQPTQSQAADTISSQPVLSQFRGSNMSPRIRAFAFLTLGLCLCVFDCGLDSLNEILQFRKIHYHMYKCIYLNTKYEH